MIVTTDEALGSIFTSFVFTSIGAVALYRGGVNGWTVFGLSFWFFMLAGWMIKIIFILEKMKGGK